MTLRHIILFSFFLINITSCVHTHKSEPLESAGKYALSEGHANKYFAGLEDAMINCPDRIWPKSRWDHLTVIFTMKEQHLAYQGSVNSDQLEFHPIEFSKLASKYRTGAFTMETEGNSKILAISSGSVRYRGDVPNMKDDFELTIHEGFHFIIQKSWKSALSKSATTSRYEVYPFDGQPRYLRYKIFKSLDKYYRNGHSKDLREASYWLNTYKEKFAEDYQKNLYTDAIEGSAMYAGVVGASLAYSGCDTTEEELKKESLLRLDQYNSSAGNGLFENGSEPYVLGLVAGMILRGSKSKIGWESKVAHGQSPTDILLANIVPSTPEVNDDDFKEKASIYKQRNDEFATKISPFLVKNDGTKYISLIVDMSRMLGSFSVSKFIITKEGNEKYLMSFGANFLGLNDSGKIEFNEILVRKLEQNECYESGYEIRVPASLIDNDSRVELNINTKSIKIERAKFKIIKDALGNIKICI